ncbi:MAG: phage terminase large subunit family protein [Nitrosotalea sp.]
MSREIINLLKRHGYDVSSYAAYSRSISSVIEEIPPSLINFSLKYRILHGIPFTFDERPYLTKIYLDQSHEINIVKPRQMEITEFGLNWLLHNLLLHKHSVGLYVSDRFEHVKIFSNLRLRQWAIESSPKLEKLVNPKKGSSSWLPFKNGSNLYMLSAWGDFEATRSIPADFVVVDEMQSVNVEALPVLQETMAKSRFKKILKIGTGSDEGDAWWKEWYRGTRYEWQKIGIDPLTGIQILDWVSQSSAPIVGVNSYHLDQQMAPWIQQTDIEYKRNAYSPRRFANEVLGLWFKGMRKPLLEADIRALMDRTIDFTYSVNVDHTLGPVYAGFDWGGGTQSHTVVWIWQVINNDLPRFRLLYVTKLDDPSTEKQANQAIELIDNYEVDRIVMDAGGGPRQVEKLSDRYAERVYKAHYLSRPEKPFEPIDSKRRINVDRTWIIEAMIDLIIRPETRDDFPHPIPRLIIPGHPERLEEVEWVIDNFTCIESETSNAAGRPRTIYTHPAESPDDALHAACYAYMCWLLDNKAKWYWERLS